MYRYFIALLLLSSCSLLEKSGKDWYIFRGDEALSGYSNNDITDDMVLHWSYDNTSRTASSPVIYNGVTYLCDKKGLVKGISPIGEECFRFDLSSPVESSPLIIDSMLYIGRMDGRVNAISLAKQDTVWGFETWGQVSSSANSYTIDGKRYIIFGSYDNFIYSVDAITGKEAGRYETGYYINGATALSGSLALFGGCDSYVRLADLAEGNILDSVRLNAYVPSSPAISGNEAFVNDYSGTLYKISLLNNKLSVSELYKATDNNSSQLSTVAIDSRSVYMIGSDKNLYSIGKESGTVNWQTLLGGEVGESSPIVTKSKVIACTKSGIIFIIEKQNGKIIWQYDTGETITASPAIADNKLYILTAKGKLFCFAKKR